MKFKSDIEVQAGLKDSSGAAGTSGQVLSSNGTTVSWINSGAGIASDVQNEVKASVAINKGQAVYVTDADGTNIIVGLASNTTEATSSKTLGLLNATVAANGMADVVQIGRLAGLNTIGAVVGDPVWLGTNGNLIYGLANKPYAPAHLVFIGIVTRVNANNGEIFITVQNGFELKEIHDVDIVTNVPINGDVLGYNGTLWVNKTIAGWLGYTPANAALTISTTAPLQGGGDLSTNRTLSITQATTSTNGYLSSTDWNTFNNKQNALTNPITGTGTSGQVAFWNGTNTQTGSNNLTWNNSASRLLINATTSDARLVLLENNVSIGTLQAFSGNFRVASITTGNLEFWTSGVNRAQFSGPTGNLLLNTTTDNGARLQVTGTQSYTGTTATDLPTYGAELLTTGSSDASWTGTSFATGYTHVAGSVTTLTSTLAGVVNNYYQIAYTVTGRTAGSFTIAFGGQSVGSVTATGTFGPRATTTDTLVITPTSDFNGTIVLSIRQITATSTALTSFRNSAGTVVNEIRTTNDNTNVVIGVNAGRRITTGTSNTFNGQNAGQTNTTGNFNSFFGSGAGQANITGDNNTSVGVQSLTFNTTGSTNSAFGVNALYFNTAGQANSAFGRSALQSNITGGSNVGIGNFALSSNTISSNNVAIGSNSLQANNSGGNNVAIGFESGRYAGAGSVSLTSVDNSIYIGYRSRGLNATGSTNEIVIGYNVVGLGSNTTVLGNSSTVTTAIYGRLLLGTTTDNGSDRLQVTGNGLITGTLEVDTVNNGVGDFLTRTAGGIITRRTAAEVRTDIGAQATLTNPITGTGTTNYLSKFTSSGVIGNSSIYDNGTNVGIGTTSPAARLEVYNSFRVNEGGFNRFFEVTESSIKMYGVGNPSIKFGDYNTGLDKLATIGFEDNFYGRGDIRFNVKGQASGTGLEALRITSSGNVGIGTTSPSVKLEVVGNIKSSLSGYEFQIYPAFDTNVVGMGASSNHNLAIVTNAIERMRITSGGDVGIGTSSPNSLLDVESSSGAFISVGHTSTSGARNAGFRIYGDEGTGIQSAFEINQQSNGGYVSLFSKLSAQSLLLGTANTERMRITSGGELCVGRQSSYGAGWLLNVEGNIYSKYEIRADLRVTTPELYSDNDLKFLTNTSERMRITSGGILQVNGGDIYGGNLTSDYGSLTIRGGYGVTSSLASKIEIRGFEGGGGTQGALIGYTNGVERFRVMQGGNFGIGTTSPSYTLHVNGSVAGTSAYVNLSDKRYKKDILPIENALDKILALNGVTFNWDKEATDMNLDNNNHIGLLAQDVEKIIPQAVVTSNDDNETKSVAYTDLVPVLIEAIKELKQEIETLKNK